MSNQKIVKLMRTAMLASTLMLCSIAPVTAATAPAATKETTDDADSVSGNEAGDSTQNSVSSDNAGGTADTDSVSGESIEKSVTVTVPDNPDVWTNEDVILTPEVEGFNENDGTQYSWDGGDTWSNTPEKAVTANGFYTLSVKDADGDVTESEPVSIINIDKQPVALSASMAGTCLTVNAADAQSGVRRIVVAEKDVPSTAAEYIYEEPAPDAVRTYTVEPSKIYTVDAYDTAGNKTTLYATADGDAEANIRIPTKETMNSALEEDPSGWTNKDAKVILKLPSEYESSLGDGEVYSFDGGNTWTKANYFTVDKNGTYKAVVQLVNGKTAASDNFKVTNIDKENPSLSVSVADGELKIKATDNLSGIKKITVAPAGGSEETVKSFNSDQKTSPDEVVYATTGASSYDVYAYDHAGNKGMKTVNADGEGSGGSSSQTSQTSQTPQGSTLTPEALNSMISEDPSGWVKDKANLVITMGSGYSLAPSPYSWDNGASWVGELKHAVTDNGSYSVWVKSADGSITKSGSLKVTNFDKGTPGIRLDRNADKLTIVGKDSGSGVVKIEMASDAGIERTVLTSQDTATGELSFDAKLPAPATYTVYVTDSVGNESSLKMKVAELTGTDSATLEEQDNATAGGGNASGGGGSSDPAHNVMTADARGNATVKIAIIAMGIMMLLAAAAMVIRKIITAGKEPK